MGLEPKVQKFIQLVERFWQVSLRLRSIGEYIPWFIDHYGDGGTSGIPQMCQSTPTFIFNTKGKEDKVNMLGVNLTAEK